MAKASSPQEPKPTAGASARPGATTTMATTTPTSGEEFCGESWQGGKR
ncbi:MAG TPA: hypothetical protein PK911_05255 [Candidatus Saccharibacteria bacterium]|nr:hypothetical protein [Candidatus Saccharibacteria bacterium]